MLPFLFRHQPESNYPKYESLLINRILLIANHPLFIKHSFYESIESLYLFNH